MSCRNDACVSIMRSFIGSNDDDFTPITCVRTGFLDWVPRKMQRVGCMELLNTVQRRVQPKLHVFGHIHEGKCQDL